MSELSFEQMLEGSLKTIRTGEVVEGTVIDVKEDEIILNIGYKADGIITRNEYSNQSGIDLREVVKEGDKMKAKVLKVNDGEGQVLLTYKRLAMEQSNEHIREAFENHTVLKATVTDVLTGGLSVVVEETKVFIPASLVSDTYEKDLSKYAGQEIEFVISEFNPKKRRIIGDRKQLLVAEKKKLQEELFARIHVGDVVEGTVKNLTDFGAFIDLGGADGLLHISEMSWTRKLRHPSQMVRQGDEVEVVILGVDPEKKRISLGMKQIKPNPWELVGEKYPEGTILEGVIKNITEFGMFIGIEDGIDGLIHVSDISWTKKIRHPNELFKVGDTVQAKVLTVDQESEKFTLGIKQLTEDPWTNVPTAYPVGGLVKGIITNITDFGLFVEVEEGIEGLVHVSELSNKKVKTPAELYKEGEEIQAKIIHVSAEDRRLGLSIKQLKDEEERKKPREYSRSGPEAGQSLGDLLKQKFEESEN